MKIDNVTFDNVTITSCPHGEVLYDTPGTYNWVAPAGVTSVSVACIGGGGSGQSNGGGGGGGGGLGYINNLSVTPGTNYTVVVGAGGPGRWNGIGGAAGGDSYFSNATTVKGGGGGKGTSGAGGAGGTFVGTGGNGGAGGQGVSTYVGGGGGGAGGWSGAGGAGGQGGYTGFTPAVGTAGSAGTGGAAGGGSGQDQSGGSGKYAGPNGGGGVTFYDGLTNSGSGGNLGTSISNKATAGQGGSGGADGLKSIISDNDSGRGYWGTTTATITGNTLTFGSTVYAFSDSLAAFGSDFVGRRFHWTSSNCDTDLYIVANISGTGANSQWRLNKTPSTSPPGGGEYFFVTRVADGGRYGGGGGGGDGNGLECGQGANGAVRIIWPGQTRSFPSTVTNRLVDYGFDIPRPAAFHIDATNSVSYTSGATTINDISGNNLNGTITAGTSLSGPGIVFNGTSQSANFGNILGSIASNQFSVGCWFKFPTLPGAISWVIGKQSTTGAWAVGVNENNRPYMRMGGQAYSPPASGEVISANTWVFLLLAVETNGTLYPYINGSLTVNGAQGLTAPATSTTGNVYIAYDGTTYSAVHFGEAFFYRKLLTSTEVLQIYNNTKWKYGL